MIKLYMEEWHKVCKIQGRHFNFLKLQLFYANNKSSQYMWYHRIIITKTIILAVIENRHKFFI